MTKLNLNKTKTKHKRREIKSHERGKLKPFLIHQKKNKIKNNSASKI